MSQNAAGPTASAPSVGGRGILGSGHAKAALALLVAAGVVLATLAATGSLPGVGRGPPAAPPQYAVTFTESGLPAGSTWSVDFDQDSKLSVLPTVSFSAPNGLYAYSIGPLSGFHTPSASGTVDVNDRAAGVTVPFAQVTYPVTFWENGLAPGTMWSVTLNGSTQSSSTNSTLFAVPNGSYPYTIGSVSHYTSFPSSATMIVEGSVLNETIVFTPGPFVIAMSPDASSGAGTTFYEYLEISPTVGLETSYFGLHVTTGSGPTYPVVSATGVNCTASPAEYTPASCNGTAGGWYAVLTSRSGGIVALYSMFGWTYLPGATTIALDNGYTIVVITAILIAGNAYTLGAFGVGPYSVSGSVLL